MFGWGRGKFKKLIPKEGQQIGLDCVMRAGYRERTHALEQSIQITLFYLDLHINYYIPSMSLLYLEDLEQACSLLPLRVKRLKCFQTSSPLDDQVCF